MSVKLIHGLSPAKCADAMLLGGLCYAPRDSISIPCDTNKTQKLVIDLATLNSVLHRDEEDKIDADATIIPQITVNFGYVAVDTQSSAKVTIIDSRQGSHITPVVFVPAEEAQLHLIGDNIFRIVGPDRRDLETKRMGWSYVKSKNVNEYKFRIIFSPKVSGTSSLLVYKVKAGDSVFHLHCRGCSEGPAVHFSQNVINFGGLYYGSETKVVVTAYNFSSCPAHFQFDTDNARSIFRIFPVAGLLAPKSSCKLEIVFRPIKPQTFYKRVYCLIHQQKPQYLDLIGLCIPRPYFVDLPIDFCVSSVDSILLPLPTRTSDEYFCCEISGLHLSNDVFNFGPTGIINEFKGDCDLSESPKRKVLKVQSTIPYDVVMEWIPDPTKTFTINPATTYLNALSHAVFEINFHPLHPDTFYSAQLECYVYPTTYTWPNAGPPWVATKKTCDAETQCIMDEIISGNTPRAANRDSGEPQSEKNSLKSMEVKTTQTEYDKLDKTGRSSASSGARCSQTKHGPKPTNMELEIFLRNGAKYCIFTIKSSLSLATAWQNTEPIINQDILSPCEVELYPEEYPGEKESTGSKLTFAVPDKNIEGQKRSKERKKKKKSSRRSKKQSKKNNKSSSGSKKKSKKKIESSSNSKASSSRKKKSKKKKRSKAKKQRSKESDVDTLRSDKKGKKGKKQKRKTDTDSGLESTEEEYDIQVEEEDEQGGNENVPVDLGMFENGSGDVGTQCENPPRTRESEFVLPTDGKECGPGPTELAIPLCLTIRLTGTTYVNPSQPPIPEFVMPSKVLLNVCFPQSSSTGTFLLKNTSDLPLIYCIGQNYRTDPLSIKPSIGVVLGHSNQVIMAAIKSQSLNPEEISHTVRANVNCSDENQITIRCSIERPSLKIKFISATKDLNRFICTPTHPNTTGIAYMKFINTSRFQYKYFFHSEKESENHQVFLPAPSKGVMEPFEETLITWSFHPPHFGTFKAIWVCTIQILGTRMDDGEECPAYDIPIPIRGVGMVCNIMADPSLLDFGTVCVFKKYEKTVRIHNIGQTLAVADLLVYQEKLESFDNQIVKLSTTKIRINPGKLLDITVTITAETIEVYKFYVDYCIGGISNCHGPPLLDPTETQNQRLFEITFVGKHPELQFTKIEHIARHPLWDPEQCASMFQLSRLNKLLTSDYNLAQNNSLLTSIPTIQCQLPSGVVGSLPSLFSLELSAYEETEAAWEIHTQPPTNAKMYQLQGKDRKPQFRGNSSQKDSPQLLTLLWTEKYESISEKHGNAGMRRKSLSMTAMRNAANFNVSPLAGTLNAADKRKVEIFVKFSYEQVGIFRMPILLRVYPAIFIWVELTARVLRQNEPSLQIPTAEMIFLPVRLDDPYPPVQMCDVYNGGERPVTYTVHNEPFEQLRESTYGHEVFHCITKTGEIQPRSWGCIKFRFTPIEYQEYSAPLKVIYGDEGAEESSELTLVGRALMNSRYEDFHLQSLSLTPSFNPYALVDVSPCILMIPKLIAPQETITRIILVLNQSEKCCMSFSWPPVTMVHSTTIEIFPDIGILAPLEQYICQIRITASPVPHVLSTSIRCWTEAVVTDSNGSCCEQDKSSLRSGSYASHSSGGISGNSSMHPGFPGSMSCISRLLHISARIGYTESNEVGMHIQDRSNFNGRICAGAVLRSVACEDGSPKAYTQIGTTLSSLNSHVVNEIMRLALWEIVMGPTGPKFLDQVLKIQTRPPIYSDYKASAQNNDSLCAPVLTTDLKKQALDFVLATMLQEIVDDGNSNRPNSLSA